ncbi:MAG: hypothetical protein AAF899_01610 [Pseudomonadota bacterium]
MAIAASGLAAVIGCAPATPTTNAPVRIAEPGQTAAERRLADWTAALEAPLGSGGVAKTTSEAAAAVEAARAVLGETRGTLAATRSRVVQGRLPQSTLGEVTTGARRNVALMRRASRATASRRAALAGAAPANELADLDRRARSLAEMADALNAEL